MNYRKAARREALAGYLLIAPAVGLFIVIGLFTVLFSIVLSFFSLPQGQLIWNAKFVGLDNFKDFLSGGNYILSGFFRQAIVNNLWIAFAMVVIVIPLALIIAVLLEKATRGVRLFRTIFLLPMVTSSVAIYYVWQGLYDPTGSINQLLASIGLDSWIAKNGWIGEMHTALPAIIVTIVWGALPHSLILYFAGLQAVDTHLYEAADIDGANAWQKLVRITWPVLKPITVIVMIMNLNVALQVFDQIWVMTKGGPAGATQVVNVLVYQQAFFQDGNMGVANAMGWTMFMLTFILSLISLKLFGDKKGEESH
ncbi:carbohydrate ABC transporter permease [Cohnella phaseoli]|uniref:Multiple sugar transport system permease protein n=1 Tax=Cohnella phaseoli TaxID=456490 RepID=A0A3D9IFZ4_9BACL|nr:sugar ABC transporter permease [Cohnella phaseoli]RED60567.1 multiple sugar transport system permease protein [Cohnella phaseoli]